MAQPQVRRDHKPGASVKADRNDALADACLGQVSGGTGATPAATSTIMKTKHDTVKNSISNVR
jgi:hypothetical protein